LRNVGLHASAHGLDQHGLADVGTARWNLGPPALYELALARGEGRLANGGALVVRTGAHTGRAPNDKFIVAEPANESAIWWGAVNKPISTDRFDALHKKMRAALKGRDVFVQDCWVGAASEYRLPIRVITESAWHSLFARNMFLQPTAAELGNFQPEFTVLHMPSFAADPAVDGTNSDVFILVNFAERQILIGGTIYAGEIKKSVFSILNYLLPARDVLPMHSSVNVGPDGHSAIFFGLSGTGKTKIIRKEKGFEI
jgi:phosphoenolpyruvate carboxykinase (ATP)